MLPKTTEGARTPTPGRYQQRLNPHGGRDQGHHREFRELAAWAHSFPHVHHCRYGNRAGVLLDTGNCGTDSAGRGLEEMSALILERLWDLQTGPENRVATWPGACRPALHPPQRTDKALPSVTWGDSQCDHTVRQHTWDFGTSGCKDKMLFHEENILN